jgi:hypothetical protein
MVPLGFLLAADGVLPEFEGRSAWVDKIRQAVFLGQLFAHIG